MEHQTHPSSCCSGHYRRNLELKELNRGLLCANQSLCLLSFQKTLKKFHSSLPSFRTNLILCLPWYSKAEEDYISRTLLVGSSWRSNNAASISINPNWFEMRLKESGRRLKNCNKLQNIPGGSLVWIPGWKTEEAGVWCSQGMAAAADTTA